MRQTIYSSIKAEMGRMVWWRVAQLLWLLTKGGSEKKGSAAVQKGGVVFLCWKWPVVSQQSRKLQWSQPRCVCFQICTHLVSTQRLICSRGTCVWCLRAGSRCKCFNSTATPDVFACPHYLVYHIWLLKPGHKHTNTRQQIICQRAGVRLGFKSQENRCVRLSDDWADTTWCSGLSWLQ